MKRWFQSALVLALMASTAASSQAEICLMKFQGGQAQPCTMNMANHRASQTASHHDCCPKATTQHKAAQMHCPPVQLSAGMSGMTCYSLDPQPQSLSQVVAVAQPIILGTVGLPLLPPSRAKMVPAAPLPSPENPVFRLKDDLRI